MRGPEIPDLNYAILKDKRKSGIVRKFLVSKLVMTAFLLLIQIFVWILFIVRLQSYMNFFLGGNIVLSAFFMIHLSNCAGKNEFKITWLLPAVVFPLFGVSAYVLYHTNIGGAKTAKRLAFLKAQTDKLLPSRAQNEEVIRAFPQVKDIQHYLINQGHFCPHKNNKVRYFANGETLYPELLASLKAAKEFIFMEFFIIDIDETWFSILRVLEEKVQNGVEVRILYDAFGSIMLSTRTYENYLKAHGIKSKIFLPLRPIFSTQQNNRDHRKIIVIDGKTAFTGGINLKNEYFNVGKNKFAYWKDNFIKIEGSAVLNLTLMFLQTWNISCKGERGLQDNFSKYAKRDFDVFPGEKGLVIPYGDDAFCKSNIAEDVYLYILSKTQRYIYIMSPYVVIDNQILEALIFAARRGADVKLIVPSQPDHIITFCIGKVFLKTLAENKIRVFLYDKGFIHAKTFVSDDKVATVGSINLDYRSLFHHFECGTFLYNVQSIADIKNDFIGTLADCKEMRVGDYEKLPLRTRLTGRIFKLFAPLL